MELPTSYLMPFPGLADRVAACPPSPTHSDLLRVLSAHSELPGVRLVYSVGDIWLARKGIVDRAGALVADDHEAWLAEQVVADGGDAARTHARLKDAGMRLARTDLTRLFFVADDDGDDPARFLQLEIVVEDTRIECDLFDPHPWRYLSSANDLVHSSGAPVPENERTRLWPAAYRWRRATDVDAWLMAADALEEVRRDEFRARRYTVTSRTASHESSCIKTANELFPGWDKAPPRHRRFFLDWQRSSAGRAARLCDHWSLELTDWTAPSGKREMTLVPAWTFRRPIAKVDARKGSDYEFYGRLEKLDRRVGVPFGWFFFMVGVEPRYV